MTRPKVDPAQRQRTAQACDSCKRRKQKCNGLYPCDTCGKRKLSCSYNTTDQDSGDGVSPAKRRLTEDDLPRIEKRPRQERDFSSSSSNPVSAFAFEPDRPGSVSASIPNVMSGNTLFQPKMDDKLPINLISHPTTASGYDEEAENHTITRMLEDSTGRLLYIGDAATLSFLQLIRMMVETTAGPSPFTADPRRHCITEATLSMHQNARLTHLLPDRSTALVLVDSFFVNTSGMMKVFDEKAFVETLDRCYSDPLSIEPLWLCLLNLVFAIGLTLATPMIGSQESVIIEKLRVPGPDRSEVFYLNAVSQNNPVIGLEDADFWSIQALLLMAMYMLTRSKRNTAYAYLGMSIRSAYALGLHREETQVIFTAPEQILRQNMWQSLFVMDRFLSASLGRPTAVLEDDCSGDTLKPWNPTSTLDFSETNTSGLEASVRSCHDVGMILRKVYQRRKISTKLAQELADQCKTWPANLSPNLHWRQASSSSPRQAIAILHVNLLYCHSVILLTRPFFLYLLNAEMQRIRRHTGSRSQRSEGKLEKFSNACIIASLHTVALAQSAYEGQYLPRCNPFVVYFLFAAALILLSNEFTSLSFYPASSHCIQNTINILSDCGESDPQAARNLNILIAFRDVVVKKNTGHAPRETPPLVSPPAADVQTTSFASSQPSPLEIPTSTTHLPIPTTIDPPIIPDLDMSTSYSHLPLPSPYPISSGDSFSGLLDLTNTVLPTSSEGDSSSTDEHIDFNALWQWPGIEDTDTMGMGMGIGLGTPSLDYAGVQVLSDSSVPLFGTVAMGGI